MEDRIKQIQEEIRFEKIKAWVILFAFSFLISLGMKEMYSMKIFSLLTLYSFLYSTPWLFWLTYLLKGTINKKEYPIREGDDNNMYIFEYYISKRNELARYTQRLEILIVLMIIALMLYFPLIKFSFYGTW